jgi:hypothetical protein
MNLDQRIANRLERRMDRLCRVADALFVRLALRRRDAVVESVLEIEDALGGVGDLVRLRLDRQRQRQLGIVLGLRRGQTRIARTTNSLVSVRPFPMSRTE